MGEIELDESYFGVKRIRGKRGRGAADKTPVFFCNPYASYEKGQVENTNKLIRQFYPKKMELDNIKQKQNLKIMDLLNKRPRKKLGYKNYEDVFFINFEIENSRLALAC